MKLGDAGALQTTPRSSLSVENNSTPREVPELSVFLERRFNRLNAKYGKSQISEEEAYSSIIGHSIRQQFGREAGREFAALFRAAYSETSRQPGKAGFERAANRALRSFTESTTATEDQIESIKASALKLAQFDRDTDLLYDSFTNGRFDSTKATKSTSQAIAKILSNQNQVTSQSVSTTSTAEKPSSITITV